MSLSLQGLWLLLGVIVLSSAHVGPFSVLESSSHASNESSPFQSYNGSTLDVSYLGNGSSTMTPASHRQNASTFQGILVGDNEYSNARNEDGKVRIVGSGSFPLVLNTGRLTFDLCGAAACQNKILACFDSTTDTSSMSPDPRNLCGYVSQCGFQVDMTSTMISFMGKNEEVDKSDFFANHGVCQSITMFSPKIKMFASYYSVCTPTVIGNEMTLNVRSASEECLLVVVGAQLKSSTGSPTVNESAAAKSQKKDASESSTDYWWILYVVLGLIILVAIGGAVFWFWRWRKNREVKKVKKGPPPSSIFVHSPLKNDEPVKSHADDEVKAEVSKPIKSKADTVEDKKSKLSMITSIQAVKKVKQAPLPVKLANEKPAPPPAQKKIKEAAPQSRPRVHPHPFVGRSGSVKSAKKDSMQDRMHELHGHMMDDPFDSLVKVHPTFKDATPGIKAAYTRSLSFSLAELEVILLVPVSKAYKKILELGADAKKDLERVGVKFDGTKAVEISEKAREMARDEDIAPFIKGYLFMAEYGHYFQPTDILIEKYSAPLLYFIALHPGYEQLIRRQAFTHMRRHLRVLRLYWSTDERNRCHYPLNCLDDAYETDRVSFARDVKTDSNSSVRKSKEAKKKKAKNVSKK